MCGPALGWAKGAPPTERAGTRSSPLLLLGGMAKPQVSEGVGGRRPALHLLCAHPAGPRCREHGQTPRLLKSHTRRRKPLHRQRDDKLAHLMWEVLKPAHVSCSKRLHTGKVQLGAEERDQDWEVRLPGDGGLSPPLTIVEPQFPHLQAL